MEQHNGMKHTFFFTLGLLTHRYRWFIITLWIGILIASIPCMPHLISPFKTTGFIDENASSTVESRAVNQAFGYDRKNLLIVMYQSNTLLNTNPLFIKKIKKSLADLNKLSIKHEIIFPGQNKQQLAKDKHSAYAVVIIKDPLPINDKQLTLLKAAIKTPSHMQILFGGEPFFIEAVNKQTQIDLFRADLIATPIAVITLLLIFGTIIAAIIPIVLGGACALIILTVLFCIAHFFTLSIFTLNIALLLGLCLCLDYSLLIISRFREELDKRVHIAEVIAVTQATAGKAIFFSAIAVFTSLSALLFFPINILFSVAVGGMTAVIIAMFTSMIVLPAVLAIIKNHINKLPVRRTPPHKRSSSNIWRKIATAIVYRPRIYCALILTILLMLGYPFLSAKFGISDYHIFPNHSESRLFFDDYSASYNENELSPITMIVRADSTPILSQKNLNKIYTLTQKLKKNSLIARVNGITATDPQLTTQQYYPLYHIAKKSMNLPSKQLLETTTRRHFTLINIISRYPDNSHKTERLISDLQKMPAAKGLSFAVIGNAVSKQDVLKSISQRLPYALLWIVISTYFILLFLLRSLFLPIKAILMNFLSLSACYGALVLVFQDGYLHHLLNFDPQGLLDISLLVIIFCALFGFSMDYEVFLLTRIKESYDSTHNHEESIISGIEKSSRIITSAAIIVIFICGSFMVADVLMVKAFGLGIAVAIFVDAFLIRTVMVPSTMILLKSWNWYLPKWLNRCLP